MQNPTWPLQQGNLTYAGRISSFTGMYIDAFGEAPAALVEIDGRTITYSDLSQHLWDQASSSPSCGVTCFNNVAMVQCNAHLLINNVLHDRLFDSKLSATNSKWLTTLEDNLLRDEGVGSVFYFATQPNEATANVDRHSVGTDIWTLFLMSGIVPDRVTDWFQNWQGNVIHEGDYAYARVGESELASDSSRNELATAWAYCLARELGQTELADKFRRYLAPRAEAGFEVEPYTSGLFLLGETLDKGAFYALVNGAAKTP